MTGNTKFWMDYKTGFLETWDGPEMIYVVKVQVDTIVARR